METLLTDVTHLLSKTVSVLQQIQKPTRLVFFILTLLIKLTNRDGFKGGEKSS